MTLNILFFTIIIKRRQMTQEEAEHNDMVEKLLEENKARQAKMMRQF
ncbi:YrzI family small protein [Mesobacillus foraminis]|uniref:Uncharacterized protein (TIGR02413 family) n=1 Tax=Mesobacillus foraminis TaxID=279826 RepID=A0A4R2BD64_9BACI|nr:YrzI family small protein [Mesobacillus foraminis]TCN24626.1 uncharacterized protein (TIGR02413 family) [Mesobacillus foraminis]